MATTLFVLAGLSLLGVFVFTEAAVGFALGFILLSMAGGYAWRKKNEAEAEARAAVQEQAASGGTPSLSGKPPAPKGYRYNDLGELELIEDLIDLGVDLAVMEALAPEELGDLHSGDLTPDEVPASETPVTDDSSTPGTYSDEDKFGNRTYTPPAVEKTFTPEPAPAPAASPVFDSEPSTTRDTGFSSGSDSGFSSSDSGGSDFGGGGD